MQNKTVQKLLLRIYPSTDVSPPAPVPQLQCMSTTRIGSKQHGPCHCQFSTPTRCNMINQGPDAIRIPISVTRSMGTRRCQMRAAIVSVGAAHPAMRKTSAPCWSSTTLKTVPCTYRLLALPSATYTCTLLYFPFSKCHSFPCRH